MLTAVELFNRRRNEACLHIVINHRRRQELAIDAGAKRAQRLLDDTDNLISIEANCGEILETRHLEINKGRSY